MGRRKISSLFSCFTGSSARAYVSPRASARETPRVDIQSHCSHPSAPSDSQSTPPEDVPAVMQNHTPSIAPSDVPSSSTPSSTSAVPSSSTPSSSVLKEPDHTKQISRTAGAVDPGNVNADLNDLSNYIRQYLEFKKHGGKKPSRAECDWPDSTSQFNLKEILSGLADTAKDFFPDAKTIAQEFLQGMGGLHVLATGFLVVGKMMERYEKMSDNTEECLLLLERMNNLIQEVKELQKRRLMEAMEKKIKDAIELIIQASLACCTQIDMPKYRRFFSTTVNKKELQRFQSLLTELHREIQIRMTLALYDSQIEFPVCPGRDEEFRKENEVQIKTVTERLKLESEERAVAVILYGLGGTGKTALADAVYWSLYHEKVLPFRNHEEVLECKYSYVRMFDNRHKAPKIEKLQTQILKDLTSPIPEIKRYEEGRDAIKKVLEEEKAVFIYIDNVSFPGNLEGYDDAIQQLLPKTTENVKKLRLLITTRDKGAAAEACNNLGIERELYAIETLEYTKATQLVKGKLNGRDDKLDSKQIDQIVQICGGIPLLLEKVADHINNSQNRKEAQERYQEVISETEKNWNGHKGWNIARDAFAHDNLGEDLKDPFFDICLYFQGWHWEELSNIVGKSELNRLENKALVTKDVNSMTAKVHNVILAIGIRNKGRRFKFTSASEFQEVLNPPKDKDLRGIQGIWSDDNIGPLDIPSSKLDLMCGSLRVLALQNSTMVSGRCNQTFAQLYFFSAEISHIPFDLSRVKQLRHLCYSLDDSQILCQMPPNLIRNLRILQLRQRGSIEWLPESIGQFNSLVSIDLSSTDLKELPDGFCSLSSLTEITMENCQRLENLPDRFGQLRSLRKLSLSGCVSLKKLPDSFSQLKDLEALNLSRCVTLEELCADFKSLSSLRVLSLKDCKMLKNLPQDFHCLTLLENLCLSDCHKLEGKPMESIVKIETLQIVDIQGSPLLHEAWQNIEEDCNQLSHKVVRTSGQASFFLLINHFTSTEENTERKEDIQISIACMACGEDMESKSRRNVRD